MTASPETAVMVRDAIVRAAVRLATLPATFRKGKHGERQYVMRRFQEVTAAMPYLVCSSETGNSRPPELQRDTAPAPAGVFLGIEPIQADVYHTHMNSADLMRELKQAGWQLDRIRGSHHVFKHPAKPGIVVLPHPKKDLGAGLVKAIRRQAGIVER